MWLRTVYILISFFILNQAQARGYSEINNSKYAILVFDKTTNQVLFAKNSDVSRYPASLTKMMTLYLTFAALQKNLISLNQEVTISRAAAMQPKSNIGFKAGEKVAVKYLILAAIIKSANDAAYALAETVSGSEKAFVNTMNYMASSMGMHNTHFVNSNGLHFAVQKTTADDLLKLGIRLKHDFPHYYYLFDVDEFTYNGNVYFSHNLLNKYYKGVNGIKTGYTGASGYNLVTSMDFLNHEIFAVVMGMDNALVRDYHMKNVLDYATHKIRFDNHINSRGLTAELIEQESQKLNNAPETDAITSNSKDNNAALQYYSEYLLNDKNYNQKYPSCCDIMLFVVTKFKEMLYDSTYLANIVKNNIAVILNPDPDATDLELTLLQPRPIIKPISFYKEANQSKINLENVFANLDVDAIGSIDISNKNAYYTLLKDVNVNNIIKTKHHKSKKSKRKSKRKSFIRVHSL